MGYWSRASLIGRHTARRVRGAGALPDFLLLGAQKAGTTTLFHHLCRSRDVLPPLRKEVHYFDQHKLPDLSWYRAFFDPRAGHDGAITGEATPLYLSHPDVPHRIEASGIAPRFLVILRCPIERAWSHYRHEKRKGRETRPFADALAAEVDLLDAMEARHVDRDRLEFLRNKSYLSRGRYGAQIARYHALFGADRMHILSLDQLHAAPRTAIEGACAFLGVRPPDDDDGYGALNAGNDNKPMPAVDPAIFRTAFAEDLGRLSAIFPEAAVWLERVRNYGDGA